MPTPVFPLYAHWPGEPVEVLLSEEEVCGQLEWIDSTEYEEPVRVFDATGREVILIVERLEIEKLGYKDERVGKF